MQTDKYVLGIDTSNYTTSIAVVDSEGNISCDLRKRLSVKQGEKGLRQSYALFQHVESLPALFSEAVLGKHEKIGAVSVSVRPRPAAGSYMPVFKAGESFASVASSALAVPIYTFSHQEGHIEAVKRYSRLNDQRRFLCYHLSGGTCELLKVEDGGIEAIGGTKDISFGQLLDRIGVQMGMSFPCGEELDEIALGAKAQSGLLKPISIDGCWINLSGIETQAAKVLKSGQGMPETDEMVRELFDKICRCLYMLTESAARLTGIKNVLFTGGVCASRFIMREMTSRFSGTDINVEFGDQKLSSDNAVGIALLGGKRLWQ